MRIGRMIQIARKVKGLTLRELELETGIHNSLINQIETGHVKDPSFIKIVKLCEALDLSVEKIAKNATAE